MALKIFTCDPQLKKYKRDLHLRMEQLDKKLTELLPAGSTLSDFATGHLYFGFHKTEDGWY